MCVDGQAMFGPCLMHAGLPMIRCSGGSIQIEARSVNATVSWDIRKGFAVSEPSQSSIAPDLLEILACPACKKPVHLDLNYIVCAACGRRYPIRDGIPVMLIDEAEQGPTQPAQGN